MSISHMQVASVRQAIPAVKTTKLEVQSDLLIGNDQFHIIPAIAPIAPAAKRPEMRSRRGRGEAIHRPAITPMITVPTAGIVDSGPSGSYTIPPIHMCF